MQEEAIKVIGLPKMTLGIKFLIIFLGCLSGMLVGAGLLVEGSYKIINSVNQYDYEKHNVIELQSPIKTVSLPITAKRKETQIIYIDNSEEKIKETNEFINSFPKDKQEIVEKIMKKFGRNGLLAISVAQAESGLTKDAVGVNLNKTTDIGVFQINFQSHKNKPECSLEKISTVDGNIDCAYTIFTQQGGFQSWVAYNTGRHIKFYQDNLDKLNRTDLALN